MSTSSRTKPQNRLKHSNVPAHQNPLMTPNTKHKSLGCSTNIMNHLENTAYQEHRYKLEALKIWDYFDYVQLSQRNTLTCATTDTT